METEALEDNPLFCAFSRARQEVLDEYRDARVAGQPGAHWAAAKPPDADGCHALLLLVPQALSLRSEPDVNDVRSHVLLPIEEAAGQFRTLDGHRVAFHGSRVAVPGHDGFSRVWPPWAARTVHILCTEDVPGEPPMRVLHVDRPLRGGCRSPCTLEGMTMEQVDRFVCMLRALPEHELLFDELGDFARWMRRRARTAGANPEQALGEMARQLRRFIRSSAEAVMDTSELYAPISLTQRRHAREAQERRGGGGGSVCGLSCAPRAPKLGLTTQTRRHTAQLEQVLEGYILFRAHDALFELVRAQCAEQDARLEAVARELRSRGLTQQDVRIRAEFQCAQTEAVRELARLGEHRSALSKLQCLATVLGHINESVEEAIRGHVPKEEISSLQLTADDLLDQLIYVIVWAAGAGLRNLSAHIDFIRHLHTLNVNTSALGYNLANVEVAVQWLLNEGPTHHETIAQALQRVAADDFLLDSIDAPAERGPPTFDNGCSGWPKRAVVLEAGVSQEVLRSAPAGWQRVFASSLAFRDVAHFACSKFTPDLHCRVDGSGRVRVSTGMHHSLLSRRRFTAVAVGENHILAVEDSGALFAWGSNSDGQLGVGETRAEQTTTPVLVYLRARRGRGPQALQDLAARRAQSATVVGVACGARHSMALTEDGELWTWGRGNCGRLGHGSMESLSAPCRVAALKGEVVLGMAAGWSHSLAWTHTDVFSFGCGRDGRLGLGSFADEALPARLDRVLFENDRPVHAAAGFAHTAVLTAQGRLLMCGSSGLGQLGLGAHMLPEHVATAPGEDPEGAQSFHQVSGDASALRVQTASEEDTNQGLVQLEAKATPRWQPMLAVSTPSEPFLVRTERRGTLCLVPRPVEALRDRVVVSVDCGKYHTAAVTAASEVLTWGFNDRDELIQPEPVLLRHVVPSADAVVCGCSGTFVCAGQEFMTTLQSE